jgi:hypothetical protein
MLWTPWNISNNQNLHMDHSVETADPSFALSRKCYAKDSVSTFVFICIQKYIEKNPRRSAFKIQNVLCEQAFNCFAWVTSFFFGKHRKEQRTLFLTYGEHKWMPDRKMLLRKWTRLVSTSIFLREFYFCFQVGCFAVCNPTLPHSVDTAFQTQTTLFFTIAGSNLRVYISVHTSLSSCTTQNDARFLVLKSSTTMYKGARNLSFQYPGPFSSNDFYSNVEFFCQFTDNTTDLCISLINQTYNTQ